MATTKTFSLYLAKTSVDALDTLLTESAKELITRGRAKRASAKGFADENALFTFPGAPVQPKWVKHLESVFTIEQRLTSQFPCAVLAFKFEKRIFALTFSYGHVYLDDAKTEADFGLKVAINAVADDKLRSVERSNIGAAIRDFAQAAGQRDLKAFGFDEALDLIRKVSGHTADDEFADLITGSRALRFSKKIELADVPSAASEALALFGKRTYQNTSFKIIDFLSPVLDSDLLKKLNDILLKVLKDDGDDFELALPEILPTGVGSFRFERAGFSRFHSDLSLDLYRDELGDDLKKLTIEQVQKHRVAAYSDDGETRLDHWSVYRSLAGSIVFGGKRYAISEGIWYRLDQAYKDAADQVFKDLYEKPDPVFRPLTKISGVPKGGAKEHYQSEESYNAEIAKASGYLLLDRQLIEIPEEPGRGIEACDLLDIKGRRFIHVKKSSRQSSVLSHFFKQGANSAQMLKKYPPFREGLVKKVKELYGATIAKELEDNLDKRWVVEFQIADAPRRDGTFDIPFFSKLTLREEARDMQAMTFGVSVRFIKLATPH